MSWHNRRDIEKRMTSKNFSDYPNSEYGGMEDHPANYSHGGGGRKPFSPIAEVEEEDFYTEERSKHKDIGRKKSNSPKNTSSPKQPSLSPQSHSSSSGHSSPRSPPTYTHPPPPTSQPPPLPPSQQQRSSSTSVGKSHSGHTSKTGYGMEHNLHGMTGVGAHRSHLPSSYEPLHHSGEHQARYVQRVGGVGKSHQLSDAHSSSSYQQQQQQQQEGNRFSKLVAKQQQQQQQHLDGNYNTSGLVNSRVHPSKMFPAVSELDHSDVIASHSEQLIDPGDRGSPSGASSPSTTPNNTLGKAAHHLAQESLQASSSNSKLTLGIIRRDQDTDQSTSSTSSSSLEGSKGDGRSSGTTVHFSNVSFSVHNSHNSRHPPAITAKSGGGSTAGSSGSRVLVQPPRSSAASSAVRVAQFNQNGNHSFGEPHNDNKQQSYHHHQHHHSHHQQQQSGRRDGGHSLYKSSSTTSPESGNKGSTTNKGVKTPSPKTVQSPEHNHSGEIAEKVEEKDEKDIATTSADGVATSTATTARESSPTSSSEELTSINVEEDTNETDSAPREHSQHSLIVPEASHPSTKQQQQQQQQQQQHQHGGYLPKRTHGNTSHMYPSSHMHPSEPLPPAYMYSLSQGGTSHVVPPQGLPPTMQQSLSQGHPPYSYDPPMYNHPNMYPNRPGAYENTGRPRHMSPPQQYEHQPPYSGGVAGQGQQKHQAGGYRQEHHHSHRGHPANIQQYIGGGGREYGLIQQPPGSKLSRPDHHYHAKHITMAHEAVANGEISTLRRMISSHEVDAFTFNEHKFSLAHTAALNGRLPVLKFLVKEAGLPLSALQIPDDSLTTPAMLAIQGRHLECLQWLIEEGKVTLEVRDTGGETLMHHAAFYGQALILEWLLTTIPKEEKKILDECGVTPAHFAAQGGHLECLQLLIDRGYSVINSDKDNQRPVDWADAMGQHICVRYLSWYEACWTFSNEITQLQRDNDQLRETLALLEHEHQVAINNLKQAHDEKVKKIRDQYVDLTASILKLKDRDRDSAISGLGAAGLGGTSGGSPSSKSTKSQSTVRKAAPDPPSGSQRRSRPPVHPDAGKKRSLKGSPAHESKKERGGGSTSGGGYDDSQDQHDLGNDRRMATPQEVLEKTMTSVAQRMNASREARKRQGGRAPRTFSPLTPVIQRMYSNPDEDQTKVQERPSRSQRSELYSEKRSAPKVKFSTTVTEFGGGGSPAHSSSLHGSNIGQGSGHKKDVGSDHNMPDSETTSSHSKSDSRKGSS